MSTKQFEETIKHLTDSERGVFRSIAAPAFLATGPSCHDEDTREAGGEVIDAIYELLRRVRELDLLLSLSTEELEEEIEL